VAAAKYGYLYQGQRYVWQKKNRGTSSWGVKPAAFVNYLENHDRWPTRCAAVESTS